MYAMSRETGHSFIISLQRKKNKRRKGRKSYEKDEKDTGGNFGSGNDV